MVGTIIASIIIFGLLIFVHELGHYLVAKWAKIRVFKFAIGYGKELFSWEKGKPVIPFAYFLWEASAACLEKSRKIYSRRQFSGEIAGRTFLCHRRRLGNEFSAGYCSFSLIFFVLLGVPVTDSPRIGKVIPESRAFEAGLKENDLILAIDGVKMDDWNSIVSQINSSPGKEITLQIQREQENIFISVIPEREADGRGLIGITPVYKKYDFFSSIKLGFENFFFWIKIIYVGFYQMIMRIIPADVTGPVGIVSVISEVMQGRDEQSFSL